MIEQLISITSHGPASPLRGSISGIMGSTSLACWIVLLMPQLIEQWRLKSADGIAIGFITIWFLGDVFNLVGALWAHLLPQVMFLAVWFCFADFLMIFSYLYYQHLNKVKKQNPQEHRPLIEHRRTSSTLTDIALEPSYHGIFTKFGLPILFVVGCGLMGFLVSDNGTDDTTPIDDTGDSISLGPQIVGYLSAVLYLGARIPQIVQNHRRKSVHGLSLLFFLFSTLGNLTYAGQILCYRSDSNYVLLNLSWLLGSLGTIFEDSIIFLQFYIYKDSISDDEFIP
ncbi:hypothetical protein PSN45_002617 [Yamadazyma tenuis]|uniref:PQ-loop-domain-containing protein n=1 Tax=Candida tenuis (strain ATCC 10573 / BCRC 21748 / CBS 615 / JCM 9827 / NBRC 10315 / NRRL Y-1498 / VKM Y-70) TaxID=590646 RepID=G3AZU2_CANTC|nr:uncharacterized protein CANTEDRAFT_102777 [Yamadazyma tenuis ATCC 10573]EGV65240.1 hypothetical protein CANTEDRAFT_102777 [Yamadazyma tenuis ATCC 10573]WEJ95107.1 hypothetical protein PSN45_002617 [Yamadazyma tenuis]